MKMGAVIWQKGIEGWPFLLHEMEIDPLKTALLIVDISNHYSRSVERILPNNVKLQNFFRENGLPVLYCLVGSLLPDARDQHIKRRLTWRRSSADEQPRAWPRGTFDYAVHEKLKPLPSELIIDKDSQGAFASTAIDYYLRSLGIQNLVVTGVATAHCVESTARDAADRGFNVILVEDACADGEIKKHNVTMHTFPRFFGALKSTDEVITDLRRLVAK